MQIRDDAWLRDNGLTIDLFAGGGGMSVGWEQALGRPIDLALNHDRYAVTLHAANHPRTVHLCQDIYQADPVKAIGGKPVFWLHASPSCTQFSRSRRALPAERQLREMAWKVLDWVDAGRPLIVTFENVQEWTQWGDLDEEGFPIPEKKGETWAAFIAAFKARGYTFEWKILDSADYGAPTQRHRLFAIARRDGVENRWPEATHGPRGELPWNPAGRHIDWSVDAPSIFARKRPLAAATQIRIMKGIQRFIYQRSPYLAPIGTQVGDGCDRADQVAAFMAQNHALLPGRSLDVPASTICTKGAGQALVTASFVSVMRRNSLGSDLREPIATQTASGGHFAEVRVSAERTAAFCTGYFSQGGGQMHPLDEPIGTITTRDRFALVTIHGEPHRLVDIGYRMLTVDELWRLQSFPDDYKTDIIANGKPITDEVSKRLIGNSVVPAQARAFAEAILSTIGTAPRLAMAA